ncbi:Tn3 family transposase [Actinoallomurus sp. WRP6H-15]|nr:Tn3 family transposase [Actinoallomurus soli]MCO5972330.1 Tn3 family transposase [Actinoallomurus soli]
MLVRRHLEVCVFTYLAAELSSGDIAAAGSDSYANLHHQLMSWEDCRPLVPAFCAQVGIPTEAAALTRHYRDELAAVAAAVDAGAQIDTWEDNLLAETSIRYGRIAYRHVSNTYIALFSHFIPWTRNPACCSVHRPPESGGDQQRA